MLTFWSNRRKRQVGCAALAAILTLYLCSVDAISIFFSSFIKASPTHLKPIIEFSPRLLHHNPDACRTRRVDILFVTPSAPGNSRRRQKIRNSGLYKFAQEPSNNASLLFFLGSFSHSSSQNNKRHDPIAKQQLALDAEVEKYGDIVQYDHPDVYKNIRLKAVFVLRWSSTYCHNASYVIRTDDDTSIDVMDIVTAVRTVGETNDNFILGEIQEGVRVEREVYSKSYMPFAEFPDSTWPPFALGGLLGYPMKTVKLLYQASLRVPPVWLDDVYITALCRREINASLLAYPGFAFRHHGGGGGGNLLTFFGLVKSGLRIIYDY